MWKNFSNQAEYISMLADDPIPPAQLWVIVGRPDGQADDFIWCDHTGMHVLGFSNQKKADQMARMLATHGMNTLIEQAKNIWEDVPEEADSNENVPMISIAKH